jgi:beta-glucosidase-like glycosyl hydrolase
MHAYSYLSGKVGGAMIRGIQQLDFAGKFVLLLGALKHVTAYSLENWRDDTGGPNNGTKYSRFGFDANITRHDLAETYLEQYRIAIQEGAYELLQDGTCGAVATPASDPSSEITLC